MLEEIGNFRDFRVFNFVFYNEIENWENSEIFSDFLFFFEEVGNFRGFRVFDFGPYDEIENSQNSISARLVKLGKFVLFKEVKKSRYLIKGRSCALKDCSSNK